MRRALEDYQLQQTILPASGRAVVAAFDERTVTVYQAYRPEIADFAVRHQRFGGPWSFGRMSWIKPGFMWMMYRSGWASKEGQEHVLAIDLDRRGFDEILLAAVISDYKPELGVTHDEWASRVAGSDVRLQWDPDHAPRGAKLERRAIQLGLRGRTLERFASEWIVGIEDITEVVQERRPQPGRGDAPLLVPVERVYPVTPEAQRQLLIA